MLSLVSSSFSSSDIDESDDSIPFNYFITAFLIEAFKDLRVVLSKNSI